MDQEVGLRWSLNEEGGLDLYAEIWNKGIKCSKQIKALKEEYGKENGRA
jgi:hypothetical protein